MIGIRTEVIYMSEEDKPKIELLPCPFCGAEAWGPIPCDDDWSSWHCVECSECGVRTPRGLDAEEAIAVWNRRVEDNEPLSFRQLKNCEQGTPVWIEWTSEDFIEEKMDWDGDWYLVIYCLDKINKFVVADKTGARQEFKCDMYEITWEAYRREK